MRINCLAQSVALSAILALPTSVRAALSYTLDFSTATPGTILERNGLGTGFTTRLANTGGGIPANDPNLVLDRRAGWLRMTSTNADINGQRDLPTIEFIGIDLSALGYTGSEDFILKASFIHVPTNFPSESNSFDQFGAFVGEGSQFLTRGGGVNYEFFGAPQFEAFGDNIFNGSKVDDRFFGPLTGDTMLIEMSRSGGVWQTLVNGFDRTPLVQPNYLDDPNLVAGVWLYSTDDSQFIVDLTHFEVTVVPESGSAILMAASIGAIGVLRRKWSDCRASALASR